MKLTKQALEAENRRLSAENGILLLGMNALARDGVTWYAKKKFEKGHYAFGIAILSHRALIFIKYLCPGQLDYTSVHDLDEYLDWFSKERDAMTEWYKLAHAEVYEASRRMNEAIKAETVR